MELVESTSIIRLSNTKTSSLSYESTQVNPQHHLILLQNLIKNLNELEKEMGHGKIGEKIKDDICQVQY